MIYYNSSKNNIIAIIYTDKNRYAKVINIYVKKLTKKENYNDL